MFNKELDKLKQADLLRSPARIDSACGPHTVIGDRKVIALCSNDYLGLANHPALTAAASEAMTRFGFGSGASRLVSGNSELHEELEQRIAHFKRAEAALLFNSGYAANTGIIPALAKEGDVIFSDSLNHASIIDGCRLSRAATQVFRHKDMNHLEMLLQDAASAQRKLIVTDGVFSMDGDIAPMPDLVCLAEKHGALLMVDDAHGTGVLGPEGRGSVEHFGLEHRIPIQMGTLGKALGSFGAYVAGERSLIQYFLNRARSFMYSTSLPPAVCAASIAAFDVMQKEPWRRGQLWKNRYHLAEGLKSMNISTADSESPILPVPAGSAERAVKMAARFLEQGVLLPAIRPPSVPDNTSRIRATVTAAHSDQDIDSVLYAFKTLKLEGLFTNADM